MIRENARRLAHLEVNLAHHRNLNRAGRGHFSPLAPPSFPDFEAV
jgi:hypothetical protein